MPYFMPSFPSPQYFGENVLPHPNRSNPMMKQPQRRGLRRSLLSLSLSGLIPAMLLAAGIMLALCTPSLADDGPKPDPSGLATGDRTTVVDAAGNSFAVAEPTDKSAPDYAANKKAYD